MNIFRKVVLQGLKKNRTRTLVTIIGVALSAAMITAVSAFAVSLQNYVINGAIVKYGGWHVAFLDADVSFVQEQAEDSRIERTAVFANIGYAVLEGGKNPDKPYLFIAGFEESAFDTLPLKLVSGRMPENSGEVLIPAHVAANGGVKISLGDTLSLTVGDRMSSGRKLNQHDTYASGQEKLIPAAEKTYTVVGICQRPAFEEQSAPGYTLITARNEVTAADSLSTFITLKQPYKVHSYVKTIDGGGGYIFNDDVLRFMGLSKDNIFNVFLYSVGAILVALIMLGSIFLIYNSFTISLNDRMRQFGILMSVGATEKQLRYSVLFEGICIGAVGIPLGILIGIPSIKIILSLVAENFGNILYDTVPLTLVVSVPSIAAAAVISMVTILISAYIPARKAASTPVMECIRQTNEIKVEPKTVKTSKLMQRICGLEGTLALKNFKRNKRRYRSIVLSLTLSVVLFVSAATFGTHLREAAEKSVVSNDYDICFYTQDMGDEELFQLYNQLKTADGIYESSYQEMTTYSCPVDTDNLSENYRKAVSPDLTGESVELSMDIQFLEDSVYLDFIKSLGLSPEEYTGENAKTIAVGKAKNPDGGLIDMFAKSFMNLTFVDTIPVDVLPGQSAEPKQYVFMAVVPYRLKENFEIADAPVEKGLTFLSKNPSKSVRKMEKMIDGASVTAEYTLYNFSEILEENRNIIFIIDLFTGVFAVMISLIAMANVFNTISTNIRLRRRELAMLRSTGMADRNFNKMMRFECVIYGLRTLLFGLPLAGIMSWLIYKGLGIAGTEIDFQFPWVSIGISVLGVFLVIFITMLYAVSKIKKENIIDALRDDMS